MKSIKDLGVFTESFFSISFHSARSFHVCQIPGCSPGADHYWQIDPQQARPWLYEKTVV